MTFHPDAINLSEFPFFQDVDIEVARNFVNLGIHLQYQPNTPLISAKDNGETFFLILQGMAKLVLVNDESEAINLTLFRSGDFFGEMAMLVPTVRTANVISITDIDLVAVHKSNFLKILHQHPELALNLSRILARRLRAMNERIITYRLPDDIHKVAHTLLLISGQGKTFTAEGPVLLPPLSLKEWALFCQTSSENFMKSIEMLKAEEAIEWQNQRIAVTSLEKLRQCSDVHHQRLEKLGVSAI